MSAVPLPCSTMAYAYLDFVSGERPVAHVYLLHILLTIMQLHNPWLTKLAISQLIEDFLQVICDVEIIHLSAQPGSYVLTMPSSMGSLKPQATRNLTYNLISPVYFRVRCS